MLKKLFEKSELRFALLFILLYVIGNSILLQESDRIGYEMLYTIPFNLLLLAVIALFVKRNSLSAYFGLCKIKTEAGNLLFFLPLVIIATVNCWMGICIKMDPVRTGIYFLSMLLTGIVEEMLFRGFLFRAMCRKNMKSAIVVTSILFGIGHFVNLFNGNSEDVIGTICQMCYAVTIGFLFAAVLYVGKSIIPCMITHSLLNALSAFSNEAAMDRIQIPVSIVLCLLSGASAIIIFRKGNAALISQRSPH